MAEDQTLGPEGHRARLRERLLTTHGQGLADYELLELALMFAIPRKDVKPLAKQLLARFGSLGGVLNADSVALGKISGVGAGSVALLLLVQQLALRTRRESLQNTPVLADRLALLDYLYTRFAGVGQEEVVALFLGADLRLIAEETLYIGTAEEVSASPRDVLARALQHQALGVILAHNHPQGAPYPSPADELFTTRLVQAAAALGVTVHDHVIVGMDAHFSFKSQGLL